MTVAYLVKGASGIYDDYVHWNVIAYQSKERAEEHAKLAAETAITFVKEYHRILDKYGIGSQEWLDILQSNPYDKKIANVDKYINYTIEEIEWGG